VGSEGPSVQAEVSACNETSAGPPDVEDTENHTVAPVMIAPDGTADAASNANRARRVFPPEFRPRKTYSPDPLATEPASEAYSVASADGSTVAVAASAGAPSPTITRAARHRPRAREGDRAPAGMAGVGIMESKIHES
jgi:hypothetical protein